MPEGPFAERLRAVDDALATFLAEKWKLEAALSNCLPRGYYVRFGDLRLHHRKVNLDGPVVQGMG